jgi:hypothetical protein
MIFEAMRYWKPWRRLLIALSTIAERAGWTWLDNKILDYLFPDDAVYEFKP